MSALTFTLKQATAQRIDLSPLVCQNLQDLAAADIAAIACATAAARVLPL